MILPLLAIALAAPQATPEIPLIYRGSTLFQNCQADVRTMDIPDAKQDYVAAAHCQSYIAGAMAGLYVAGYKGICADSASFGTLSRVYVAYMQKHPKLLDSHQMDGFMQAMLDAYPCAAK
jgi:hypothetical protein